MYLLLKSLLSGAIIAAVSEIARRSTLFGALVAFLPLTSVLAMIWLYHESHDTSRVAALSGEIFWLVLPSLALFLVLPWLIRRGVALLLRPCARERMHGAWLWADASCPAAVWFASVGLRRPSGLKATNRRT